MTDRARRFELGARNLLLDCAACKPGDHVLLVGEQGENACFDSSLCTDVAQIAQRLGLNVRVIMAPPTANARQFPRTVSSAMVDAHQTIFFSRLGDRVRFLETPGGGKKIMCYTLTRKHLAAPFATLAFNTMKQLHDVLVKEIINATRYRIETDCGTSISGAIRPAEHLRPSLTDFTVELFPVMIFPPIECHQLSGRLVLKDFLLSTSTREYTNSVLHLRSPVIAEIEHSRIIGFTGDDAEIARIKNQFVRAASITGGDPCALNSWHAGINPYTFFDGDPYADLERWSTVAYGSPRYTHIHAAGNAPGDVSIQLFDASIAFDDKTLWERGRFMLLDRPDVRALFDGCAQQAPDASTSMDIGLPCCTAKNPF